MKTKMIIAIALVVLFLSSSTAISQYPPGDDEPNLKVNVKIKRVFQRWYLIDVTVKNLEDEKLELYTSSIPGGFYVYGFQLGRWKKICSEPEFIPMIIVNLTLEPNQEVMIYRGTWNMRWHLAIRFYIEGYLRSYQYNGTMYPSIQSEKKFLSRFSFLPIS